MASIWSGASSSTALWAAACGIGELLLPVHQFRCRERPSEARCRRLGPEKNSCDLFALNVSAEVASDKKEGRQSAPLSLLHNGNAGRLTTSLKRNSTSRTRPGAGCVRSE